MLTDLPASSSTKDSDLEAPLLDESLSGVRPNYGLLSEVPVPGRSSSSPKKTIGTVSAIFIIFNRIIGTGIFATPGTIFRFSGSVGLSLSMWVLGAVIAGTGMHVYIIWGTALPRNGGEKNYLEYLFPRPRRLITSVYASGAVLLAHGAGNSLVFAEYTLASLYPSALSPSASLNGLLSPVRILAFSCLSTALILHGLFLSTGLRLQNILGFFKIIILFIMVFAGYTAITGNLQPGVERPTPFQSWDKLWEGTQTGGSVVCSSLYNVIFSYIGFSNANYALGEMKNPERTLRIAGPLAIITVTFFYLLCNVAYFSAATKDEITGSGRLVASLLFRNVWGVRAERVLSGSVALSALGNVLSVTFAHGRVNQELAIEDILPWSKIWASNWPVGAPFAGLAIEWFVCNLVVFLVPTGDAYNFILNLTSYPLAVINTVISFGLLYLAFGPIWRGYRNAEPSRTDDASTDKVLFKPSRSLVVSSLGFGAANVFLFIVPFLRPPKGLEPYEHLPYWLHSVGGWLVFLTGALWWWYHFYK